MGVKTTAPMTAISYNTPIHLESKLTELVSAGVLAWFAFVPHKGEYGDKDHCHVIVFPEGQVDSRKLSTYIGKELLADGSSVSTVSLWFKTPLKNFGDWYLYSIHDKFYLLSKGEQKQFYYSADDVVTSNADTLHQLVAEINFKPLLNQELVLYFCEQGESWQTIMLACRVAPNQYVALKSMYHDMFASFNWGMADVNGQPIKVFVPPKKSDFIPISENDERKMPK